MRKSRLLILLGVLCIAFQQICLADTCTQISEQLAGEWQFDKTHIIKFDRNSGSVALDGNQYLMTSCIVIKDFDMSFFLNGQYVIIYPPRHGGEGAKMIFGLNTYELTNLPSEGTPSEPGAASPQSFVARYSQGQSAAFRQYNQDLQRRRVLEELARALSADITLPNPVAITIDECGQANANYQRQTITLCYELIQNMAQGIRDEYVRTISPQDIESVISGGMLFILMHEVGHALIQNLELPVLGREEDAADEIGAYFLLHASERNTASGLSGALWFFRQNSSSYTRTDFSDEHSLGPQRQSNLACWAVGKNPSRYMYLLRQGFLTQDRAKKCGYEYKQLESTIHKLLSKNIAS